MSLAFDVSLAGRAGELLFSKSLPFAYQTQRLLCQAPWGGGEVTEVARAVDRMSDDDFESWYAGWRWLADLARSDADGALSAKRNVTARERFFAAANYYRTAEFFLPPDDPRKIDTWEQMVRTFTQAGELWDPPFEEIHWPYEGHSLPGYLVKPAGASGRLPTVVYLNGADGTKEESWYLGGRLLVDRGVNFVSIEGPGQGEPLRLHNLYTRPDYEAVTAPLLDQLVERDDVDPDRIGLIGISMGGYYAARIAAYEERFRCVAVHGTCFNIHDDLYENFEPIRLQLQWITGTFDDAKARAALREFDLGDHLSRVKGPIYVSHGADDVLVRPQAAEDTIRHLTAADKTVHIWTADNPLGGAIHSSLDNPTQAYPEIADWMVEHLTD